MLKDIDLPESIIEAFKEIINKAPSDTVLELAKNHEKLRIGGFKPVKKHVDLFKDRLQAMVKSVQKEKDAWFLNFLRNADLYQNFTIVLSKKAIEFNLDSFLAVYGSERFLANLLLDERDEVQQIAVDYMGDEDWEKKELPTFQDAIKMTKDIYWPFLEHILSFILDNIPEDFIKKNGDSSQQARYDEPLSIELKLLRDSIKRYEERNRKLKERNATLSHTLEIKKTREVESGEKIKDFEKNISNLREESALLKAELAVLIEESKAIGNSFYRDELMLKADMFLRDNVSKGAYRHDNPTISRLNLNRLIDLIQSHYLLRYENITDGPEFEKMLHKLTVRAGQIRRNLSIDDGYSPLFHRLIDSIEETVSPDILNNIYSDLVTLDNYRILTGKEMAILYWCYHKKMDTFYSHHTPKDLTLLQETSNPVCYLKRAIRETMPFLWLLDGYNITHALKDIFYPYYEKGKPLGNTRKRLLTLIERVAKKSPELAIKVYFDSESPEEIQHTENIKVIFSGISGKHSADDRIIGDLTFYYTCKNITLPCCLVTDDKDLANQASNFGVMIMSLREFTAFANKDV